MDKGNELKLRHSNNLNTINEVLNEIQVTNLKRRSSKFKLFSVDDNFIKVKLKL